MPSIVYFECSKCGERLSAEKPQMVCPKDGGSLYVRYDLHKIREKAARDLPSGTTVIVVVNGKATIVLPNEDLYVGVIDPNDKIALSVSASNGPNGTKFEAKIVKSAALD